MTQTQNADQGSFNDELRGALFRNDKGDNPARPDYRGNVVVDGNKYKISAWVREARSTGAKYLSLALTLDGPVPPPESAVTAGAGDQQDDLPF